MHQKENVQVIQHLKSFSQPFTLTPLVLIIYRLISWENSITLS